MRSKSGPGGTLCHSGLCEVAQRQAVFVRKDKPSGRAIKSDRAKVVMTAGCISKNCSIINYTCREEEITQQIRSCLNRTALSHLDFHTSQNTSEFVLLYIFLQQGQTGDCFYQKI